MKEIHIPAVVPSFGQSGTGAEMLSLVSYSKGNILH